MTLDQLHEDHAVRLAAPERSPVETIMELAHAYLPSCALHVAARLGVADLLADGPQAVEEIALRAHVHAPSLGRVLRTLAMYGVFAEDAEGRYGLTPAAELLRTEALRDAVTFSADVAGDGSWWSAVGRLGDAVITGTPSFEQLTGTSFFDYAAERPECARWFSRGMANFAATENPAIAAAYDFSGVAHILDIGGGHGGFLAQILARWPESRGTLLDLPEVVADPADLATVEEDRWDVVAGDFFASIPSGADAYLLKRVLHDWDDDRGVSILRHCRAALGDHARLLVIDAVVPPGNHPHPAKVLDILMMAATPGRERSASEFADLLGRAGLQVSRILPTPTTLSIIEADPLC